MLSITRIQFSQSAEAPRVWPRRGFAIGRQRRPGTMSARQ
jgi:hypothetical protein